MRSRSLTRPLALWGLCGAILTLSACFSADDFADCPTGKECGPLHLCVEGRCVLPEDLSDAQVVPDSGDPSERALPDGPLAEDVIALDQRVVLGQHQVVTESIQIEAREIELRGALIADALIPGGLGGGGGGAGHPTQSFKGGQIPLPEEEAAAAASSFGEANQGAEAGSGGIGGLGQGIAGGFGGVGGRTLGNPDGQAGQPGRIAPEGHDLCQFLRAEGRALVGSGGGGGGGGRGSDASGCLSGHGGGAGAMGGAGGGAITLVARERIIISGQLSARGVLTRALSDLAAQGGGQCGDPAAQVGTEDCDDDCDLVLHGYGGRPTGEGYGEGAEGAGRGGLGGPGSGGSIVLRAPVIELRGGHYFDVSGGDPQQGEGFGGAVLLEGRVEVSGEAQIVGARARCVP